LSLTRTPRRRHSSRPSRLVCAGEPQAALPQHPGRLARASQGSIRPCARRAGGAQGPATFLAGSGL